VIGNAEKMYRRNSSQMLWANWTGLIGMGIGVSKLDSIHCPSAGGTTC